MCSLRKCVLPKNRVSNNGYDETLSQITYNNDEKVMIKPSDLAPSYKIVNDNSDKIFINDYYAPYYFTNLKDRFGYNVKGSCTYVAVDMLLSYYDSLWNDNFLPEKYDGDNIYVNKTILNAFESPGSKN